MSPDPSRPPTAWDPESRPAAGEAPVERGFIADFFVFAWENKWWWITPTLLILGGLGLLVAMAQDSGIAPFFYALF
jgi:hypothetical protein